MSETLIHVSPKVLTHNPENLRIDVGDVSDLAKSIASVGLLEPLLARGDAEDPKSLTLVAGHRRLAAIESLNGGAPKTVPVLVRPVVYDDTSVDDTTVMLVENLHRKDLSPLEEARGYRRLVDAGCKQKEVADLAAVSPSVVSRRLALLTLPESGQVALQSGEISLELAELYTKITDAALRQVACDNRWDRYRVDTAITKAAAEKERERLAKAAEKAGLTLYTQGQIGGLVDPDDPAKGVLDVITEDGVWVDKGRDEDFKKATKAQIESDNVDTFEASFDVHADPGNEIEVASLAKTKGLVGVMIGYPDSARYYEGSQFIGVEVRPLTDHERRLYLNDDGSKRDDAAKQAEQAQVRDQMVRFQKARRAHRTAFVKEHATRKTAAKDTVALLLRSFVLMFHPSLTDKAGVILGKVTDDKSAEAWRVEVERRVDEGSTAELAEVINGIIHSGVAESTWPFGQVSDAILGEWGFEPLDESTFAASEAEAEGGDENDGG